MPRPARSNRTYKPEVPVAPEPDRRALTVYESAYVLHVSTHTVWRMIATGELSSFKVGSRRLVSRATLEQYMADSEAAATAVGQ